MQFDPVERIGLFIDGASTFQAAKLHGYDIDYKRFIETFRDKGRVMRAFYFSLIPEGDEHIATRPLLDWLDYNGFTVITRSMRQSYSLDSSILVDVAVETIRAAKYIDHIVLFSGDCSLTRLIGYLKDRGKRVSVVSTTTGSPAFVCDQLRRKADQFIELGQILPIIGREADQKQRVK